MAKKDSGVYPKETSSIPDGSVKWQTSFSLLTNRFFIYDLFKLLLIMFVVMNGIFFVIFAINGDLRDFTGILKLTSALLMFFLILIILICLFWFRNRFYARFSVSQEGAKAEVYRKRDKAVHRAAAVIGALAGSPSTAGAGLLAMSGESVGISWEDVCKIKEYPVQKVITLMNNWRVVVRLYCTNENYDEIAEAVRLYTKSKGIKEVKKKTGASSTSVKRLLLFSVLAVVGSVFLFAVPYQLRFEPVMAVAAGVSLFFAIWIPVSSRFYGAFSLAWTASVAYIVLMHGFAVRSYDVTTESGVPFTLFKTSGFEGLQANEWFGFVLFCVGLLVLLFLEIQAVRGKINRVEDDESMQTDFPAFYNRLFAAALIAACTGLAVGWFRTYNGFFTGIQGLVVGGFFAYAIARVMKSDPEKAWTFDRRQILLLVVTGSFLVAETLVIELSYRSLKQVSWLVGIISGDMYEHIFGMSGTRGWHRTVHFKMGAGAWFLFTMLDIVFQVFMTTLVFIRDGKRIKTKNKT